MTQSSAAIISSLKSTLAPELEQQHAIGTGILRVNVKPDDLALWQDTLLAISKPGNILLACESNSSELEDTQLTWVVGAAIRNTSIHEPIAIVNLLETLGVDSHLAAAVPEHCPGLAREVIWAFYLERHGWLTASPIVSPRETPSAAL